MQRVNLKSGSTPTSPGPISRPRHTTISGAALHLLRQTLGGDKHGRNFAEMIAATLVCRALRGDSWAMRELMRAVPVSQECPNCGHRPMSIAECDALIRASRDEE